jgi:hypothetical protein
MLLKRFLILMVLAVFISSCSKSDNRTIAPPRDFGEQYAADKDLIENFLKENYLVVDEQGNASTLPIPTGSDEVSIWNQQDFPLQFIDVINDGRRNNLVDGRVDDDTNYRLYYIILNEGGGLSPSVVDSVFTSYRGWKVIDNLTFDTAIEPAWLTADGVVSGFRQILPLLKTAESFSDTNDGTVNFVNFGNALVFIPSGLGYFNTPPPSIGAYQPLVFQIQLKSLRYRDHDRDGILSKDEIYGSTSSIWLQDTDGDNIPDFLDRDDDGDRVLTRNEIKDSEGNIIPFDLIPSCSGNTTDPDRLKKHLDPTCQ